ncbi:hypothetical protein F8M41_024518 [Gigaspora margarita]|uniref:Uncharacterized protein n=1 Tax=Gigaspora margarita TaxID=4874 RepID=A0A8H4ABM4_GIGMA|nr:hypothetical protein F8M41_024518 [Gigaspora margarita]
MFGDQEKKGTAELGDKKEKVDKETREAQMALMILKKNYARALELKDRVQKIDIFTACLSILCIIIGYAMVFLKENVVNLDSVVSLSVSAGSFIVSGGGAIAAFRSLFSSSSDSNIEKGGKDDKGPNFDLAESATLIVQSKLRAKVYKMIKHLKKRNSGLRQLELFQSIYLFAGCIVLFVIAAYDFLNFVTKKSNGTVLDWILVGLGIVGLLYCAAIGLVLQFAKDRFTGENKIKFLFCFVCPFAYCVGLISRNEDEEKKLDLVDIRFSRADEENILYLLYGVEVKEEEPDTRGDNTY